MTNALREVSRVRALSSYNAHHNDHSNLPASYQNITSHHRFVADVIDNLREHRTPYLESFILHEWIDLPRDNIFLAGHVPKLHELSLCGWVQPTSCLFRATLTHLELDDCAIYQE